ncbi:PLP-dependent transferase [Paxillus ammoniavirescens]|nr:PLP-dependent transferase [Paxillus ammoniavirescens]
MATANTVAFVDKSDLSQAGLASFQPGSLKLFRKYRQVFATLTALIQPQECLMGLGLPDCGHLTHVYYTAKKTTASSIYFQSFPYVLDPSTQDGITQLSRPPEKEVAYLMADIAHTSGLIAAQQLTIPSTTAMSSPPQRRWTHFTNGVVGLKECNYKTLHGPRAGLIFFGKHGPSGNQDLKKRVNEAVFPACQGGPHNTIVAVIANAKTLAPGLLEHGYKLQTGGTDHHRPPTPWVTGSKVEKCNMMEDDNKVVVGFLHRVVQLTIVLHKEAGSKLLKDSARVATTESEGKVGTQMIRELRKEVVALARKWPLPGADVSTI